MCVCVWRFACVLPVCKCHEQAHIEKYFNNLSYSILVDQMFSLAHKAACGGQRVDRLFEYVKSVPTPHAPHSCSFSMFSSLSLYLSLHCFNHCLSSHFYFNLHHYLLVSFSLYLSLFDSLSFSLPLSPPHSLCHFLSLTVCSSQPLTRCLFPLSPLRINCKSLEVHQRKRLLPLVV